LFVLTTSIGKLDEEKAVTVRHSCLSKFFSDEAAIPAFFT